MSRYQKVLWWIVIVGGLLWGYNGITGLELQTLVMGTQLANVAEIIIGIAAVLLIYMMMTGRTRTKKK